MKALGTKVIISQDVSAAQTAGGIVMPDSAVQKLPQGTVVDVGLKVDNDAVMPGDRVIFNAYAGAAITVDGKSYIVLEEADILVVL